MHYGPSSRSACGTCAYQNTRPGFQLVGGEAETSRLFSPRLGLQVGTETFSVKNALLKYSTGDHPAIRLFSPRQPKRCTMALFVYMIYNIIAQEQNYHYQ